MSVANPGFTIVRHSVVGIEGEWAKMYDPPQASPPTPELVNATNPVPEVMAAAGFQVVPNPIHTVTRDLFHGIQIAGQTGNITFFAFGDRSNPTAAGGVWPAPTTRVPRGVVFHGLTNAAPAPHTIHWHGIEPTPMNDGVGHCSMELGTYTYQWQPNFIGTYFYHCHRNTVQHFEYGLYGMLLITPPDAFFASCATDPGPGGAVTLNGIPIGACRDGLFRMQTNMLLLSGPTTPADPLHPLNVTSGEGFEGLNIPSPFPGFIGPQAGFETNPLEAPDTATVFPTVPSVPAALQGTALPAWLKFATDPHAMTLPYDVEALWVLDDRDSVWSTLAPGAFATFPAFGPTPGIDDKFHQNPAGQGFFAFNQHNADNWWVTGVPVPALRNTLPGDNHIGRINANVVIPPALNSGMSGLQVPINAQTDQTIYLRVLDAAYNSVEITFPFPVVITAWDGRALGVPPYGFSHPYLVPALTPIRSSTARRTDFLLRFPSGPAALGAATLGQYPNGFSGVATVKFIDNRGEMVTGFENLLVTAEIPININLPGASVSGIVTGTAAAPLGGVVINAQGPIHKNTSTSPTGNYSLKGLIAGTYQISASLGSVVFPPATVVVSALQVTANAVITKNFTAPPAAAAGTFTLTGSIFSGNGVPLSGVTVNVQGPTLPAAPVTTGADGSYIVGGLSNGNYTVIPSKLNTTFTPAQHRVTINGANQPVGFFRGMP